MLSPEASTGIAGSFVMFYYKQFVRCGELTSMADLYAEASNVVLADESTTETAPVTIRGRTDIIAHLNRIDQIFSPRKVEILTADNLALPDGGVQVICQGILFLPRVRRYFIQTFVLAPTPYRSNAYHIVAEFTRFTKAQEEDIPAGVTVLRPDQMARVLQEDMARREQQYKQQIEALTQQQQQQATAQRPMAIPTPASKQGRAPTAAGAAAVAANQGANPSASQTAPVASTAPAREERGERKPREERGERKPREERGERKPREERGERKPREERGERGERKPREERGERGERKPREERGERKPRDEQKDGAAENRPERKPRAERKPRREGAEGEQPKADGEKRERRERKDVEQKDSAFVRLVNVPKTLKLSDIKSTMGQHAGEEPKDAYWFGRDKAHTVVEFSSASVAGKVVSSGKVKLGDQELSVVTFYVRK